VTHAFAEYAAVAVVFCALTGLGALPAQVIERAGRPPPLLRLPLLAISGWGFAALVSAIAALGDFDQTWLARALMVLGLALLIPRRRDRTRQYHLLRDLALLLIFVAPMGLLVAGTPAMAFDEFAQWLPNTRYLVEHGHYWNWPDWLGLSSKPGYPNASAVIALLVSQLAGPDVEAPFKTFVVVLLGGFGAALAGLAATRFTADPTRSRAVGSTAAALLASGCLIAFLDPFMDPRIGFTAYTDTPSGIVLALAALAGAYGIGAARRTEQATASGWFAWAGLLSLTLVLLRQTNLVFVAAFDAACFLFILCGRSGSPRLWLRWALLLAAPAAIGLLIWQAHLSAARIGPDIAPRPFAAWDWSAPLTVARAFILDRLADNPLVGGAAAVFVVAAAMGGLVVWRRLPDDEGGILPPSRIMAALAAIVSLGFAGFLAWAYIAVFTAEEVAAAASLWRYLSELGPLLVLAGICVVVSLLPKWRRNAGLAVASMAVGVVALLLLPWIGRSYYRLDCRFPDVAAARVAIGELRPALAPFRSSPTSPARIAVVNPTMGDWMAYALAFDMRWPDSGEVVRFRVKNEPLAETEAWAWDQGLEALLDFRALDRAALRAQSAIPAVSLLGRPAAKGDPWPILATTPPRALPVCSAWAP
jgi:hypothetical protein